MTAAAPAVVFVSGQCANGVHFYDEEHQVMLSEDARCVNCHRCVATCPTRAIKIVKSDCDLKENANWNSAVMKEIYKQAASGGVLLSSMGSPTNLPVYWDKILINASQVTNPSIDPLREPMETKVFLGKQPARIRRKADGTLDCTLPPQLELAMPVMFSAMSYGSISYNAHAEPGQSSRALWASTTTPVRVVSTRISTATARTPSSRWPPAGSASMGTI